MADDAGSATETRSGDLPSGIASPETSVGVGEFATLKRGSRSSPRTT